MWSGAVFSGELDCNKWFSSALKEIYIWVYLLFFKRI